MGAPIGQSGVYPRIHDQLEARPEQKPRLQGAARRRVETGQLYRNTQEALLLAQLLSDSAKGFSGTAQDPEVRQERSAETQWDSQVSMARATTAPWEVAWFPLPPPARTCLLPNSALPVSFAPCSQP